VTTALRNAIVMNRVPHAILLCGPRGVGKTTIARILARCLNCEKGPTDTPCGSCASCQEIAAGRSTDVQEIDAASRTSVDDVRELIEAVRYAPSPGRHRIFVVDEVHMLSTPAFNALLKTLEEPPPRSLFVFATTNPEKIPFTVVSRCQRYDLRRLPTAEVTGRLGEVARAEGIAISERSLLAIAREGEGSLRDALTLLDQVVAFGGTQVADERVAEVLDLIDRRLLLGILEACVAGDAAGALAACGRAAEAGIDPKRLGAALLGLVRDLVVLAVAPERPGLVEGSDSEIEELRALAGRTDPGRLRRMFRALIREQEDLAWAPQPFAVLEMAAVRLATMAPGEDVQALLARLDALERRLGGGGGGGGDAGGGGRRGPERGAQRGASPSRKATRPEGSPTGSGDRASGSAPGDEPAVALPVEGASLDVVFDRIRAFVLEEDRGLAAALESGRLIERREDALRVAVAEPFAARRLERRRPDLERACARLFGRAVRVAIVGPEEPSGDRKLRADESEAARRQRRDALDHPAVNRALEILGGEVVEIRPLGGGPGPGGRAPR
jgi:DNA polymerase-3 subunit gamma/tau